MDPSPQRPRFRHAHALIAGALALASPLLVHEAHADDPQKVTSTLEGVVLSIETSDLVIDLGSSRGASEGDVIEVWRPFKLRHPVTGKMVEDRFKIGSIKLIQVRPAMSLARPEGNPSRSIEKGDLVLTTRESTPPTSTSGASTGPTPKSTTQPTPTPVASGSSSVSNQPPIDPDAAELITLFDQLRGADLTVRIERYEAIARSKPRSRYAAVLYEEARALRSLLNTATKDASTQSEKSPFGAVEMNFPSEVSSTLPVDLTLSVTGARGMVLQVRARGATGFTGVPMDLIGNNTWRGTVPAALVKAPGFDFFIEATDSQGKTSKLVASIESPTAVAVRDDTPPAAAPPIHVTASLLTDLALYNTKKMNDYAWQTEGFFAARFSDVGFRAIRSGFGVYRGKGGTLDDLDVKQVSPRSVGLTYGYLESEYAFVNTFSMALRIVVGLRDSGVSGGAQGFMRIGSDRATNLVLGGEFLGGIGVRGITQLEWNTIPRVPIVLRTEVTNQPAGVASSESLTQITTGNTTETVSRGQGEIGARVIAQVGYRLTPALTVALRGSYQGRTINHAGPGGGAGVTYEW